MSTTQGSTPGSPEPRIGDYAIIGDCRSAALVGRDGAIDWLCWPRFDSPALLAGLLDRSEGGVWSVRPTAERWAVERRYLPGTAVLETVFTTGEGVLALRDFMPVASERSKSAELWPQHQLLRGIECLEGSVEVRSVIDLRPGFGRRSCAVRDRGASGLLVEMGADAAVFNSDVPHVVEGGAARGGARLAAGESAWSSLSFTSREPAYLAPLGEVADRRLRQSVDWWREWSGMIDYDGAHAEMVVRSAITLKLLTYAPSGAVVAAPTTSLPERIGGARNWDYRYCWLRDAAMTVRAFYDLGCAEEGDAFASWILHATRLSWPEVRVLYDVYGNPPPAEREEERLSGYRGSAPVRVGNAARDQFQLDVYGEVVRAVVQYVEHGGSLDRSASKFLRGIAKTVCTRWSEPDDGIWEARAERRHHTYSKARCWAALDDLLTLDEDRGLGLPRERMRVERDRIRAAIERDGWSDRLGSYAAWLGGDTLDASLLLLAECGYLGDAERLAGTVRAVEERLGVDSLLHRYQHPDGLEGGEGAFGICSFWKVLALTRLGERGRAEEDFDRLLGYANDVGLFGEEIDPESGEALGNFPQAYTHVGLINAAVALHGSPDSGGEW